MKNFTLLRFLPVPVNMVIIAMLLLSSCASPQHFSFTAAPPAYQKKKVEIAEPVPAATSEETLTASTIAAPTALPEIVAATKTRNLHIEKTDQAITAQAQVAAPKQKLTLAQKVVLKKLQKQINKSTRNTKELKETSAGPVSNRSAFALILIGFLAILFGALLNIGVFYTLGALLVFIALVLLILNYI